MRHLVFISAIIMILFCCAFNEGGEAQSQDIDTNIVQFLTGVGDNNLNLVFFKDDTYMTASRPMIGSLGVGDWSEMKKRKRYFDRNPQFHIGTDESSRSSFSIDKDSNIILSRPGDEFVVELDYDPLAKDSTTITITSWDLERYKVLYSKNKNIDEYSRSFYYYLACYRIRVLDNNNEVLKDSVLSQTTGDIKSLIDAAQGIPKILTLETPENDIKEIKFICAAGFGEFNAPYFSIDLKDLANNWVNIKDKRQSAYQGKTPNKITIIAGKEYNNLASIIRLAPAEEGYVILNKNGTPTDLFFRNMLPLDTIYDSIILTSSGNNQIRIFRQESDSQNIKPLLETKKIPDGI